MYNSSTEGVRAIDVYVGKKLREQRLKLNLTLYDVAERLDISYQQVQKYEQGNTRISASMLFLLSVILGVPTNYFFEGFQESYNAKPFITGDIITNARKKSLNVLILEDDPSDEFILRKALSACSQKVVVHCIHEGAKLLRFLREQNNHQLFNRPDIILMDLNVPKYSGHDLLREIKHDRKLQDIPIIILTNSINMSDLVKSYSNYAAGFICKNFDYTVFEKTIRGLIYYWSSVVILPSTA